MAVIDREALRALVCRVVEEMEREQWERQKRGTPIPKDDTTGLSADEEAVLDALCYLKNGSAGEVNDVLTEWFPERPRRFNGPMVGRILHRLADNGLVEVGWWRQGKQARRLYIVRREGIEVATRFNPVVWEASA